jgi:hypothetical protein
VTDTAKQRIADEIQKRLGGGASTGATAKDGAKKGAEKATEKPGGSSTREAIRGIFGR